MMDEICLEAKGALKNAKQGDKIKLEMLVTGTKVDRNYSTDGPEVSGPSKKQPKLKKMVTLVPMTSEAGEEAAETLGEAVERAAKSADDEDED